jgi:hypothetical protein
MNRLQILIVLFIVLTVAIWLIKSPWFDRKLDWLLGREPKSEKSSADNKKTGQISDEQ